MTLLLLAVLAAVVVLFVLYPVFTRVAEPLELPSKSARERKALMEKKDRLYAAIKDLDFEREAGKLSGVDHAKVRAEYLSQVAAVMSLIEKLSASAKAAADRTADKTVGRKATKGVQPPETAEAAQQPRRKAVEEIACSSCEQTNPPHARFCLRCGSRLQAGAACPECGVALPEDARFCTACGVAIPV